MGVSRQDELQVTASLGAEMVQVNVCVCAGLTCTVKVKVNG
jgi:hypothetical protein